MSDVIANPEGAVAKLGFTFAHAKAEIANVADKCSNFIVNSNDSLVLGKNLAKEAKRIENIIEEKRKEITKPLLDEQRAVKAFADNLVFDLNSAVKSLRSQILSYEQEQERIRQAELRRIEEERRKAEAELRAKALELQRQMEEEQKQVSAEEIEQIQAESKAIAEMKIQEQIAQAPSGNSIRKVWTYEVTDIEDVPYHLLMPNDKAIKEWIAKGIRVIDGLRIYQTDQLNLR